MARILADQHDTQHANGNVSLPPAAVPQMHARPVILLWFAALCCTTAGSGRRYMSLASHGFDGSCRPTSRTAEDAAVSAAGQQVPAAGGTGHPMAEADSVGLGMAAQFS